MLEHNIIKKPTVWSFGKKSEPYVSNQGASRSHYNGSHQTAPHVLHSQQEYNDWLNLVPIGEKTLITYKTNSEVKDASQIQYVYDIVTDYAELQWMWKYGTPKYLKVFSCGRYALQNTTEIPHLWVDGHEDVRPLTEAEKAIFLNDKLQHYLEEITKRVTNAA